MKKMSDYQKYKLKKWIKKKKAWLITTGAFLIIGAIFLLVGFAISGWSLIDWLKSPYAVTCFVCIGVSLVILLVMWFFGSRFKIGNDEDDLDL